MRESGLNEELRELLAEQESVGKKKLARIAYEALLQKILILEIRPGEQLQERALGEMLSMSRTPVREALMRLNQENWVKMQNNQSVIVRGFDCDSINDVFEARVFLEKRGLEHIVADDQAYARFGDLAALHAIMTADSRDNFQYVFANQKFHAFLAEIKPNEILRSLWKKIRLENYRLGQLAIERGISRRSVIDAEHQEIIEAILRRDLKPARKALLLHLQRARKNLEKALRS